MEPPSTDFLDTIFAVLIFTSANQMEIQGFSSQEKKYGVIRSELSPQS